MPDSIKIVYVLLCLLALTHIMVPIVMWSSTNQMAIEIKMAHPEFNTVTINKSVSIALKAAFIFHGLFLLLTGILIMYISKGKNWARRVTTVSAILSIFFSAVSWKSSSMFHWLVITTDIIQVIIVLLLWFSKESQVYFKRML